MSGMGRRSLGKVRDGSVEPTRRFGQGRGTLGEVWDVSGDPWGGSGRVGGHTQMYGTGRGTLRGSGSSRWTLGEV